MKDLANQAFGVHGSTAYPPHVSFSWIATEHGRHHVLLAQELAYETLDFGAKVLATAEQRLNVDVSSLRAPGGFAVKTPACPSCRAPVQLAQFQCTSCNADLRPPREQPDNSRSLAESLQHALHNEATTLVVILSMPGLLNAELGEFVLASVSDSKGNAADLRRTADLKLTWTVRRGGAEHVAHLDLRKRPIRLKPDDQLMLYLCWTPRRAVVYIESDPPDLFGTSDGRRPFLDADDET